MHIYFYHMLIDQILFKQTSLQLVQLKMRQNLRYNFEGIDKVPHQGTINNSMPNMVKMAIDLSSNKNSNILNTQKIQDGKPRKSCLSQKITKIKEKFNSKSLRHVEQSHNEKLKVNKRFRNENQEIDSQQQSSNLWKMEDEFKKEFIYWNNFILVPNPKFTSSRFTCGGCESTFLKIVEFVYHCLSICGEIFHIKASHFILNKEDWTNFLQEGIKKKKRNEQIDRDNAKFDIKKKKGQSIDKIPKKVHSNCHQDDGQEIQGQITKSVNYIAKNHSETNILMKDRRDNYIQDYSQQGDEIINSIELRQVIDDKWKIIDYFEMKSRQIKSYSHNLINDWIESDKSYKFEFKVTYMQACYPYVLMVNPEKDLTGILDKKSIQTNYKRFFVKHLLDLRQPVNTPSSIYLIVLAQDFYRYLYKTNNIPQKKNKTNRKGLDLVYLKYLYQNTPYSRQIDKMYPLFKHFIGVIQTMYVYSDIIYTCKLCGYRGITINNNYLKSYGLTTKSGNVCFEYNEHHTTCPLYNKHKGGFYLRLDDGVQIFTELINIKENEGYTFFCPICANFEQQISAEQLVQHMEKQHGNKAFSLNVYRCLSQKAAFIENVFEK